MADRPGVMLYFDIRPALKFLDTEQKGVLFQSILDYAELGVVPDLDGICGLAWEFIRPKLDKDAALYDEKVNKNRYAVYVREEKRHGRTALEYEEWKDSYSNHQVTSGDNMRHPTTDSTPAPTPKATPSPNPNSNLSLAETATGTGGAGEEPEPFDFETRRRKRLEQLRSIPPK